MRKIAFILAAPLLLAPLLFTPLTGAHAQTVLFQEPPTAAEFLEALGVTPSAPPAKLYRGLSFDEAPRTRALTYTGAAQPESGRARPVNAASAAPAQSMASASAARPSAAFPLTFAVNSSDLTPSALAYVDVAAEALKKEGSLGMVIAGHTDASGGDEVNRPLSQRRAEAVRDYLVSRHGVDPARLDVLGESSQKLLTPDQPYDAVNRRVTFTMKRPAAP